MPRPRTLSRERARQMRATHTLRQIAAAMGCSKDWVQRVCRGLGGPYAYRNPGRKTSDDKLARINEALDRGLCVSAIARQCGISRYGLQRAHQRGEIDLNKAGRGGRGPSSREARARVHVPDWADRAGLTDDYRDVARQYGEDCAARHCRRLAAEART